MKEVKIIFVDTLADAGEPDEGFIIKTSDGSFYNGNGTSTPDQVYVSSLAAKQYAYNGATADLYPDAGIIELSNGVLFNLGDVSGYLGRVFVLINTDVSLDSIIDPYNTQTLDGAGNYTLQPGEIIFITPNVAADGWHLLNSYGLTASTPTLQAVTDVGSTTTNLIEGYGYKINNVYFTEFYGIDELAIARLQEVNFKREGESYEGKLNTVASSLTDNRNYYLPDQSGTIALTSDITGSAWGGITGTLSSQTDLQTALDAKASSSLTYLQTSFTIATGSYKALPEIQLLSTNRITIEGTGRLRINN